MKPPTVLFRTAAGLAVLALFACAPLFAQANATQNTYVTLTVGPDARAAASTAHTVYRKIKPVLRAGQPWLNRWFLR